MTFRGDGILQPSDGHRDLRNAGFLVDVYPQRNYVVRRLKLLQALLRLRNGVSFYWLLADTDINISRVSGPRNPVAGNPLSFWNLFRA